MLGTRADGSVTPASLASDIEDIRADILSKGGASPSMFDNLIEPFIEQLVLIGIQAYGKGSFEYTVKKMEGRTVVVIGAEQGEVGSAVFIDSSYNDLIAKVTHSLEFMGVASPSKIAEVVNISPLPLSVYRIYDDNNIVTNVAYRPNKMVVWTTYGVVSMLFKPETFQSEYSSAPAVGQKIYRDASSGRRYYIENGRDVFID